MKNPFIIGDIKIFKKIITTADTANFAEGAVHPVYSTFALARDAEWACRLFVLDMKEDNEEGIGTFVYVNHLSPALVGEEVVFQAVFRSLIKNQIICSYMAHVEERMVARGEQGQKILTKEKIARIFSNIEK